MVPGGHALRIIEDETDVRHAAQHALREAVASGGWRVAQNFSYSRRESFAGPGEFTGRIVAVDAARRPAALARTAALAATFHEVAVQSADGRFGLEQPMLVTVQAARLRLSG